METEIFLAATALVTVIGGGGVWLGSLQTKVTNNKDDIGKLIEDINGHLDNFNVVVTKVAKIETICDNIYSMLDKQKPRTKTD